MSTPPSSISPHREWLRQLPKAELHLHLEGTVTPETLVVLSKRHDTQPLTLPEARALYAYKDFRHFLATFKLVCDRLLTPDDYALIATEMMRDLRSQGVVHAEVYVAWGNILYRKPHLQVEDVMVALEDARTAFEKETAGEGEGDKGFSLLWIADATRQWGVDHVGSVFRLAAKLRNRFPSIVGVGIGGDEAAAPVELFREEYAEAARAGLRLTAHAGEATGPVQGPLEILAALDVGAERIGHGHDAQYDEGVMGVLVERQTPVEINVTSNVLTGACPSVKEHPLPKYLDKGIFCMLNSDDPAMFGSWCLDEYVVVHEELRLGLDVMRGLAKNSILASFLSQARKEELCRQVELLPLPQV
ncbi:Aminodeoxyfutalosine deaminase [Cytospora mali]|uniref:Aminodeoxyfutalosine deaminase n=1 Tax=Cytospora mali TaxID=578113 RepID=A0A194VAR8_CYTMA|nr:Aminodeoxyfutalosine deaminase [Valsa mali var. pyri (nom. inval.)]